MRYFLVALISALFLSTTAADAAKIVITREIPVDEDFSVIDLDTSGIGVWLALRIKLIEVDGQFELCGALRYASAQLRSQSRAFLADTSLTLNGKPIMKGLHYFGKAKSMKTLPTSMAKCRATGVSVPKKGQPVDFDIKWSNKTRYY